MTAQPNPSTAARDEARREQENLIRAFRKVLGPNDENRSPEQKLVWAVLEKRRKMRSTPRVLSQPIDPYAVLTLEGERNFAEHLQTLATTPIDDYGDVVVKK